MSAGVVKPVVAVDVDEVLGCFVDNMCHVLNGMFEERYTAEHFHSYHFADVWRCSDEESIRRVDFFLASDKFTGAEGG